MTNPYSANFEDRDGTVRLQGKLDFTDAANQPGLPAGSGSPAGVVTPSGIGALYVDTTDGGLYIATGVTSADWTKVGGVTASIGDLPGVSKQGDSMFVIGGADKDTPLNGNGAVMSDAYAQWNGNGDSLRWIGNGTDGEQFLACQTGSNTHLGILQDKDGVLTSPGGIIFPAADPHVVGAWWDNMGVLTKSSG